VGHDVFVREGDSVCVLIVRVGLVVDVALCIINQKGFPYQIGLQ